VNAQMVESAVLGWNVDVGVSSNTNRVERLTPGQSAFYATSQTRVVAGYPLFGRWARPIVAYRDVDGDGVLALTEIRVGDTAVYMGQQEPKYNLSAGTGLALFNGRLSINTALTYVSGETQMNAGGAAALYNSANDPNIAPAQQAAFAALYMDNGTNFGIIQTVNTLRVTSLSVNWIAPMAWSRRLGASALSVALQGSNLGLWTNYRGVDPNVNAASVGNLVVDGGQIPEPRQWQLKVNLNW
jgi:hypothetical protein